MPNKKNGGIVPAISDKRVLAVPIGCGKCMECRKRKGKDWQVRLLEEVRHQKNGKMVTLTFSTAAIEELTRGTKLKGYERDNEMCRKAIRLFSERWRKHNKTAIRRWLITEIGGGRYEHIHLHGIVFTDKSEDEIRKRWEYGYVHFGTWVNEQTVNYITKYMTKTDILHKNYTPKIFCSPGIGKGYMNRKDWKNNIYIRGVTEERYTMRNGYKTILPIYLRNKIYSDEQKERLWIEKLDRMERYVDGQKISIKNGTGNYKKAVKEARKKNKRMGYGDNKRTDEEYENSRRDMLYEQRMSYADSAPTGEADATSENVLEKKTYSADALLLERTREKNNLKNIW